MLLFTLVQTHFNCVESYFIFTDVTDLFYTYFRMITFISCQLIIWYIFYHIFIFLCPAFFFYEYKFGSFFLKISIFFWLLSIGLSTYILIPFGWNFFLSFQITQAFYFEAKITEYLDFYINVYLLSFIYCQLFTLLFFFLINVSQNLHYIKRFRKVYYYLFFLFATLVSPPDILSQTVLSLFAIASFELIIFLFLWRVFDRVI